MPAFAHVAHVNRDVRLAVVGTRGVQAPLRTMVRWYGLDGLVTSVDEEVPPADWCAAADLLVLSSAVDPCPLSLLQAMRLGRPIVAAADVAGREEYVSPGEHYVPCLRDDVGSLRDALCRTLDSRATWSLGIARAARRADDFVEDGDHVRMLENLAGGCATR
jgi:glycosyltransferase involved in cell wall biosynthesis